MPYFHKWKNILYIQLFASKSGKVTKIPLKKNILQNQLLSSELQHLKIINVLGNIFKNSLGTTPKRKIWLNLVNGWVTTYNDTLRL